MALAVLGGACGGAEPILDLSPVAAEGRDVATSRGCVACHGDSGEGDIGPAWQELFGSTVKLNGGSTVLADADYVRRAIVDPEAEVVAGATISMPVTSLSEAEVDALIAYIKEL